jgi:non-lysosomal glucosylceramidase
VTPRSALSANNPFEYQGNQLQVIDFPLGGFGAGNINLVGDGSLQHWTTILNQVQHFPNWRDNPMPACWFGLQVMSDDTTPTTTSSKNFSTLLRTRIHSTETFAAAAAELLPAMESLTLTGRYPIAELNYTLGNHEKNSGDVTVQLEAMNPLIPAHVQHSSLPCAIFTFTVQNNTDELRRVRMIQAQHNFIGWDGTTKIQETMPSCWGDNVNTPFVVREDKQSDSNSGSLQGILLSSNNVNLVPSQSPAFGTLCLAAGAATNDPACQQQPQVSVLVEAPNETTLWQQFVQGQDVPVQQASPSRPSPTAETTCCGLVQTVKLLPHDQATLTFVLSWHFPNRTREQSVGKGYEHVLPQPILGNYYSAHWFPNNAQQVAHYVVDQLPYLTSTTRLYRDTLYQTSIPPMLLECAAGRVSTLRSPTMWCTADGIVLGSEGNGCCPLNCTHVYGYTTLMERLFPTLAQNMRTSDFVRTYDPPGHSSMYCGGVPMRFGTGGWAIDGALASVIKTYLVVQQSDPECKFLAQVWPNVKDQMNRIQSYFDKVGDGVIRDLQQNTFDTAMSGANTFIGSYYVTALKALSCMATLMGEVDLAKTSMKHARLAARNYESICWKEEYGYYIADVTLKNCQASYGIGCAVDQLCGVGLSSACGFGHVFDKDHEAMARRKIVQYNQVTHPPFNDHQGHLFNGDMGLRLCSYPHGQIDGEAPNNFQYHDLVGSGFTSPVIAGLLLDRNLDDACETASHIRQRHDGRTASPWNEPECNTLYARAMAHWNIYDQACGFRYNCHAAETNLGTSSGGGDLSFDPRFNVTDFRCFVILQGGWGEYRQKLSETLSSGVCTLTCLHGSFSLASLGVETAATSVEAKLDGKTTVAVASFQCGIARFQDVVIVSQGSCLQLVFFATKTAPALRGDSLDPTKETRKTLELWRLPRVSPRTLYLVAILVLLGSIYHAVKASREAMRFT